MDGQHGLTSSRRDASGALVALPARPSRIVSLIPSITELLFALGLEERIVGVTIFCSEPRDCSLRSTESNSKNTSLRYFFAMSSVS